MKPASDKELRDVCRDAMVFKNRLGNLGLWETMQTMEDVTKKIGWESAAILTQRKAIDKRLKK